MVSTAGSTTEAPGHARDLPARARQHVERRPAPRAAWSPDRLMWWSSDSRSGANLGWPSIVAMSSCVAWVSGARPQLGRQEGSADLRHKAPCPYDEALRAVLAPAITPVLDYGVIAVRRLDVALRSRLPREFI